MDLANVVSAVIALLSIIYGGTKHYDSLRVKESHRSSDAVWKRIDENKREIAALKDTLNKHYHDKEEIREYMNLVNIPLLQKFTHIENQLSDIKTMFEQYTNKSKG